jgi:hypothetical protein
MKTVGQRKQRAITFSASGALLAEGARFNDEMHRLPTGASSFIPKGVTRFKSHEEANLQQQSLLACGMALIARHRRSDGTV